MSYEARCILARLKEITESGVINRHVLVELAHDIASGLVITQGATVKVNVKVRSVP